MITVKEMKMLTKWLNPIRTRGYVEFDSPREYIWEKTLKGLGFTPQQIESFYADQNMPNSRRVARN